jgi:hypothetical protein
MSAAVRVSRMPAALAGLIALALVLAPSPAVFAQQQLAAVQGTIVDQTGGVLPGVTVTVTNMDTNVVRTSVTNEAGVYRVPSLDPGRYQLAAELMGFRRSVRSDVRLPVGQIVGINFELQAGEVTEVVEVVGIAGTIQTEKADVSAVVEQRKIVDLPLVGRNPLALATLQPGVVGTPGTTDFLAAEQGIGVSVAGQRGSGNSATVDGINIDGGPWGGTVLIVPNVEAVQEFQVIANNPSAEYGRNSGAMLSIITKGGTNDFSGSVFQFHRNQNLRARNIFEPTDRPKPDFERNNFGGSLGGPARRDSTFFFVSYEGVRETSGQGALYTVETEELKNWVLANRPNSIAAQLMTRYPPPSYPTTGLRDLGSPAPGANVIGPPDGIMDVGQIPYTLTQRRQGNQFNARVDQNIGINNRFRATYYMSQIESLFLFVRPEFNQPYPFRNQLFTSNWTRVISSQTLNELSFGWVRQHGEAGDVTPDVPTISITGLSAGFGSAFWHPIDFTQNNFQVRNVFTMNRGTHSFRMGGEARLGRTTGTSSTGGGRTTASSAILDFVNDEPFSETRAVDPATGLATSAPGTYVTNEWGLFFQDNWKARPNLTMSLGLRYENFGNPGKSEGPFNGIVLGPGDTRQEQMANARVAALDQIYSTDWNNFAPRLGIAWDPTGDATWAIRAGTGVTYNRINNTVYSDERLNPPQFAQATTNILTPGVPISYALGPNFPANPALGRGLDERGGIQGARVALRVVDPDLRTPYIYNWFAGFQRQLPGHFVFEANYVGSASRNLMSGDGPGGEDYNRFTGDLLDGRLDRLNPSFAGVTLAESRIDSDYHGFTVGLNRRYVRGLSFQVNYTLGRVNDMAGFAQDVNDPERERGPADFDVRHVAKMNVIYELPFQFESAALNALFGGWQANAIAVYQTGTPFNVVCGLPYPTCDFNRDGYTNERLSMPGGNTDLGRPSRDEWLAGVLRADQFVFPAPMTLGDLPRNAFRGPSYLNTDLSFFKNVRAPWVGGARSTVQLRVEAFNIFNTAHLGNPVGAINNVNFGRVVGLRGGTQPA